MSERSRADRAKVESMFNSRGESQGEYADYLYYYDKANKVALPETNQAILDVAIEKSALGNRHETEDGATIDIVGTERDEYDSYWPQLLSMCVLRELPGGHLCHYYSLHQTDRGLSLLRHVGGSFDSAISGQEAVAPNGAAPAQSDGAGNTYRPEVIFWRSGPRTFVTEPEAQHLRQLLQNSKIVETGN